MAQGFGEHRFARRVAIVTGAGGDIGGAVAWRLAREGATLVATVREPGEAARAAATLQFRPIAELLLGGRNATLSVDLSSWPTAGRASPGRSNSSGRSRPSCK